jgi:NTP pyrophosphatase (non-canonical NTP hydrolase)
MTIDELAGKLTQVVDGYMDKFAISINRDQSVLKIHEEAGEFTKAYLRFAGTGRNKEKKSQAELEADMQEELADLVGMCMVFAQKNNIDLEQAIKDKWLQYL